ncbi:MAG TPA: hypothetical protein VFT98_15530 [Myxococcota bacterium]|nr:hypothetical protein [Myxococcota bacterium]
MRVLTILLFVASLGALAGSAALAAPTEWWVLAAQLDSGDRVLVEVTLTDVGPGERNAAAIGEWIAADGAHTPFSRAKLGGDWTPSADGRRIDLGKFVFDRSAARAQLRVEKGSLRIALDFPLAAAPLATKRLAGGKWTQQLWIASAPVEASLWKRGMAEPLRTRGTVGLSRREILGPEAKLAARRLEAFTLGAAPLYVLEVANGKGAERWVVALDASGKLVAQDTGAVASAGALGAPAPQLALAGPGATGALLAGTRLASYDPLANVPAPIRFLLGLRLKSTWMASPYDVSVSAARRKGTAIASYTFYAE